MKSAGETGSISARSDLIVYRLMRASSRRSHHSIVASPSCTASGVVESSRNRPRITKPSLSSSTSATSTSERDRPSESTRSAAVVTATACNRPRTSSVIAASRVHCFAQCSAGASITGSRTACG
jgi:hypothetical protein